MIVVRPKSVSDEMTNKWARMYHTTNPARSVTFQVTDDCNLRCTYCYQHNKAHHEMSFETAKKFADLILGFSDKKNNYTNPSTSEGIIFDFIGGEPLMNVNLISQISEYIVTRMIETNHPWLNKFMFSMSSNGTLYRNPDSQKYLSRYFKVTSYGVTIDGDKETHDSCRLTCDGCGSYDLAIDAVHDMRKKGQITGSKVTISPYNINTLDKAIQSYFEDGQDDINLNCVFEEGWTYEHAKILYGKLKNLADYLIDNDLYDKVRISMFDQNRYRPMSHDDNRNWCGGTGSMLAVDYKGDIYPCLRYMESSTGNDVKPLIIGHVDRGIGTLPEEQEIIDRLNAITRRSQSTDECWDCPIADGCAWCSAYNYESTGVLDKRVTFICPMHKATALANTYYWNKAYRKIGDPDRLKVHCPEEWALQIISKDEYDMLVKLSEKD